MRNTYSKSSLGHLKTCDFILRFLFTRVLKNFDHSIIEGFRGMSLQDKYFNEGLSKVRWPDSLHNRLDKHGEPCSLAIHAVPYPLDWRDRERFTLLAGYVLQEAANLEIPIRWGGDWKGRNLLNKNEYEKPFDDFAHYEIRVS